MELWLETFGVLILGFLGIAFGLLTGKTKSRIWLLGYIVPLTLIILIALTRNFIQLRFYQPFAWLIDGRREFVIFAFSIPMALGTLIPRLKRKTEKILLAVLVFVASSSYFVLPFVGPILVRGELEKLKTAFTHDDICLQTTDFTCGPASAVTALLQLGINANESELAIRAYSSPQTGTPDDLLVDAIEKLYGRQGISCTYRYFDSIEELGQNCPAIAVIKFSFFADHYVTILEVTDDSVIIGDPLKGKEELTYEQFRDKWRSVGIVLKKRQ